MKIHSVIPILGFGLWFSPSALHTKGSSPLAVESLPSIVARAVAALKLSPPPQPHYLSRHRPRRPCSRLICISPLAANPVDVPNEALLRSYKYKQPHDR